MSASTGFSTCCFRCRYRTQRGGCSARIRRGDHKVVCHMQYAQRCRADTTGCSCPACDYFKRKEAK